jgi:hypothetical protein
MDDQSLQILVYSTVAAAPFLLVRGALRYRWPAWLMFLLGLSLPFLMLVPRGMTGLGWWPRSQIVIGILAFYGLFVGTGMALATWMKRTGRVA